MESAIRSISRRKVLLKGAKLSAASIAALAGAGVVKFAHAAETVQPIISLPAANRADKRNPFYDVGILNTLLNSEYELLAVYRAVIGSSFIGTKPILVNLFTSHHADHINALIEAIKKLGGDPIAQKLPAVYTDDFHFPDMTKREDLVGTLLTLELRSANSYIAALPVLDDKEMRKLAGRLGADAVMHYTAFLTDLGKALPREALTFGK